MLGVASSERQESRHQEDRAIRALYVLSADSERAQVAQVLVRSRRLRECEKATEIAVSRRVLTWVLLLRPLKIISILDIVKPPTIEQFKEVYCKSF